MVVVCLMVSIIYIETESVYDENIEYKLGCLTSTANSYQMNKLDEKIQQYFFNQEGADCYEN